MYDVVVAVMMYVSRSGRVLPAWIAAWIVRPRRWHGVVVGGCLLLPSRIVDWPRQNAIVIAVVSNMLIVVISI